MDYSCNGRFNLNRDYAYGEVCMTSNLFRAVMITFVLLVFCFSLFSYILVTNNYERAESYKNISEQSLKLNKELLDKWVGCEAIRMNVTKDYLLETITEARK